MIYPLPTPIPSNYSYTAVRIEDMRYDAEIPGYRANVFGINGAHPMPLIFGTRSGIMRVTECIITDAEIAQAMEADPTLEKTLDAALKVAMQRLYAIVNS